VQTSPDGSRTISGVIFYNQPSSDLGGFTEVLAPGVFNDSIAGDVLCLRDHDATLLMGRTKSKTLTLTNDSAGLRFVCKLPDTTQAADLATSIERGDLDGVSFGFRMIDDAWTSDGEGNVIRTLLKVNLLEISPCSFPAYPSSTISIRSCPSTLRSKLKQDTRSNEDGCDCDCSSCTDGECDECSMSDCDDTACAEHGCPEQDDDERTLCTKSEVRKMQMRVALALRK
jgi:HK97 family phage prohead protease